MLIQFNEKTPFTIRELYIKVQKRKMKNHVKARGGGRASGVTSDDDRKGEPGKPSIVLRKKGQKESESKDNGRSREQGRKADGGQKKGVKINTRLRVKREKEALKVRQGRDQGKKKKIFKESSIKEPVEN